MPKASKTEWPQSQIDEFIAWHETRMHELNYPEQLVWELRRDRTKWLAGIKRVK